MKTLTEKQYMKHCDQYNGYCQRCDKITRHGMTEPDATGYECPKCKHKACMGIEQALLVGAIDLK